MKYLGANFEHHRICEWAVNSIIAYADVHRNELKNYGVDYSKDLSKTEIAEKLFNYGVSMDYNKPATLDQLKRMNEDKMRLTYNSIIWSNNLVDVSKAKGSDFEIEDTDNYTYLLTYSFPCGLAGTKIITKNGYKNIEDVNVGDMVLTHQNRFNKVLKTMTRTSNHYYKIKGLGVPKLYLTEEHPLYVLRDNQEQWIKVKDLKTSDMFLFNINQKQEDVEYSKELLWLLGRYVADGHINKYTYNSINFSINFEKEKEFLDNVPKEYVSRFKKFKKKCWDYRIADKKLKDLCLQFKTGAINKEIPQWVINLPKEKLQSFFDGYIAGDGHIRFRKKTKQIMFATVSEKLFLSMQQIVAKLYNKILTCSIRVDNRKETFNNCYDCQFIISNYSSVQKVIKDKIATKIRTIERIEQNVDVYNFEVEEDNSYTCQNVIVHNCQDLSLAGKGAGMEKGSGTRSGLLWEVERILSECKTKPQVLFMENVTQVHGAGNDEHFKEWQLRLEELGYQSYWNDLSATDYGIPQTRNRTFMVSILGEYNYRFPKQKPLKLRLKDLLESNVDEKYYLSQKMIDYISCDNEKWTGNNDKSLINKNIASTINTGEGSRRCDASNYVSNELDEDYDLKLLIKNATKKGYLEAQEGDGIDISTRMETHRGTVQKGKAQTVTTMGGENVGVVVNMKNELCNDLIKNGKVKENDVIRHSYTTSRMNGEMKDLHQNNLSPTLDTRCDCLGVVVNDTNNEEYMGTYDYAQSDTLRPSESDRLHLGKDVSGALLSSGNHNGIVVKEESINYSKKSLEKIINNIIDENDVSGSLTATGMVSINHDGCQLVSLKRGYDVKVKIEKEQAEEVDFIGNYSKSNFNQTAIVGKNGLAPTVTENHEQVTAIIVESDNNEK